MLRLCLTAVVGLAMATPSAAATWAEALFSSLAHDFGSVSRGPTLVHSFRLTNTTAAPLHIAGVRVSCGCVTATALASDIAPGQSSEIQAHIDTRRINGAKTVTIFVQFNRPAWDEVRLTVTAFGHDDLSVTPESLSFGCVPRGSNISKSAQVRIAGVGTHLVGVQSDSNYVQLAARTVRATETEFVYDVTATLRSDTPPGKWFTDIWLTTDNPSLGRVRMPVSVEVAPALQLSAPAAAFGSLEVDEQREKRIILRGPQPFKIVGIHGTDDSTTAKAAASDARPVHVITIGIKPHATGELRKSLRITTDLPAENVVELPVTATVMMPHAQ